MTTCLGPDVVHLFAESSQQQHSRNVNAAAVKTLQTNAPHRDRDGPRTTKTDHCGIGAAHHFHTSDPSLTKAAAEGGGGWEEGFKTVAKVNSCGWKVVCLYGSQVWWWQNGLAVGAVGGDRGGAAFTFSAPPMADTWGCGTRKEGPKKLVTRIAV